MSEDPVAFLNARLAEQERQARDWAQYDGDAFYVNEAGRELLRGVAVKRAIVDLHAPKPGVDGGCQVCDGDIYTIPCQYPCKTLWLLATEFADHPAYREEWMP